MLYPAARALIQSGDVIFQTHRPLRSWHDIKIAIVRMFTRSEWSHVGIAWAIGGRLFIIEAVSSGVRIFPMSRIGDFTWVARGGFTTEQEAKALSLVGAKYSQIEAIKAFWGWSSFDNDLWQCMEVVGFVLDLPIDKLTPALGMQYLTEREDLIPRFVENR